MAHITTAELDEIARLGLNDLRACFSDNPPVGSLEKAEVTLKLLRQGTSRMSGENNRMATALKVAKASGATPDELKPLWKQIVAGSPKAINDSTPEKQGTEGRRQQK